MSLARAMTSVNAAVCLDLLLVEKILPGLQLNPPHAASGILQVECARDSGNGGNHRRKVSRRKEARWRGLR